MLRDSSALASVFLWSVCLLVAPTQLAAPSRKGRCSKDLHQQVETLRNETLNQTLVNFTLYTPTQVDIKLKCFTTTLTCFADELKVLSEELKISGLSSDRAEHLSGKLRLLTRPRRKKAPQLESGCHQCEFYEEKSAKDFFAALLNTLQNMNSVNCD
ncbi:interleukin 15, like [Fundulus diaphanus]